MRRNALSSKILKERALAGYSRDLGTMQKLANSLGVSRQYIHQTWKDAGLETRPVFVGRKARATKERKPLTPEQRCINNMLRAARASGREYNLTREDIVIPKTCPALGIPLDLTPGSSRDTTPSLDRINNAKGYVRGNIVIVSFRANRLKSNACAAELTRLARFYRQAGA